MKEFKNVKTLDECFEIVGVKPIEKWEDIPDEFKACLLAAAKQMIIVKAANKLRGKNEPLDWRDNTLRKWFPWLYFKTDGGLDFSNSIYGSSFACTSDASRFAFFREADARKAFEIAPDVFEDFLTK